MPTATYRPAIAVLADFMLAKTDYQSKDYIEAWEELADTLSPEDHKALAEYLEICPVHHCDIEICADDESDDCDAGSSPS